MERAGCFLLSDPKRSLFDRPLGIADEWKDLENERIIMSGEKIITDQDRKERGDYHLNDFFLRVRDVRILAPMREGETENPIIAYIPNKRMEEAEAAITTAYKDICYGLRSATKGLQALQELYSKNDLSSHFLGLAETLEDYYSIARTVSIESLEEMGRIIEIEMRKIKEL